MHHQRNAALLPILISAVALPLAILMWTGSVALSFLFSKHDESIDTKEVIKPTRWLFAMITPIIIAAWGLKNRGLDKSGAALGLIVGFILTLSSYSFLACLLTFFVSSSKATKFRSAEKKRLEKDFKEGGQRNWIQVLCNGIMATELAFLYIVDSGCGEKPIDFIKDYRASWLGMGVLGAIACCNGDTWASELGTVFGQGDPFLITNWRRVPKGTNGAVTICGLIFSFLGGVLIGAAYYVSVLYTVDPIILKSCPSQWPIIVTGGIAGFLGGIVDSLLGATLQYSGVDEKSGCIVECPGKKVRHICGTQVLDNHSVNLISSVSMGLLTPHLAMSFWP